MPENIRVLVIMTHATEIPPVTKQEVNQARKYLKENLSDLWKMSKKTPIWNCLAVILHAMKDRKNWGKLL